MKEHLIKHLQKRDRAQIDKYFKKFTLDKNDRHLYLDVVRYVPEHAKRYVECLSVAGVDMNPMPNQDIEEIMVRIFPHRVDVLDKMLELGLEISRGALKRCINMLTVDVLQVLHHHKIDLNFDDKFILKAKIKNQNIEAFQFFLDNNLISPTDESMITKIAKHEIAERYQIYWERHCLNQMNITARPYITKL